MSILIESLSKSFNNNQVLNDISLDIKTGEFITLLGPSGCGKTTTLRCIAGLETPDEGHIEVGEQVFADASRDFYLPTHKRHVGMVYQSYALWPHMSVENNVAYPLKRQRLKKAERGPIVQTTLEAVGMSEHAKRYPHELSGGQQQRIALARGLVSAGGLMLFDEPLSNLDAKLRIAMRTEIRRLHKEFGNTSVYVTHDQDEALALSDRVIIMRDGQIEQIGKPSDIYQNPVSAFAADFVGFENILRCQTVQDRADGLQVSLEGGTELLLPDDSLGVKPGKFIAFRSSAAIMDHPPECGVRGAGRVRDSSFSAETRTVVLDTEGGYGVTVGVPESVSTETLYSDSGTHVRFYVALEGIVVVNGED